MSKRLGPKTRELHADLLTRFGLNNVFMRKDALSSNCLGILVRQGYISKESIANTPSRYFYRVVAEVLPEEESCTHRKMVRWRVTRFDDVLDKVIMTCGYCDENRSQHFEFRGYEREHLNAAAQT